ncbi:MAG: helix-turn-helix domain-containing protein [Erysipelotrichaceae bacterium]|nr:helix-turn-helix domain-containing protein [Erysipelotrichaceae bacterium]
MKLLICDDDISTIEVLQSQLDAQSLGITEFLKAYNGKMAMEIIDRKHPELILCDIGMPIADGIEVLKYVYEQKYDYEFSFLTCYEEFEYARIAIRYGVTSYLTKPFDLEEVKVCIQKMVANYRKRNETIEHRSQTQFDSMMSSLLRQAGDGSLGSDREMINASLRFNHAGFDADSLWRIVFTCCDMTDAIKQTWSRELLVYTSARIHDEALANYVGSAYTVVNSDDRFLWNICFIRGQESDETLTDRSNKLIEFCKQYMSMNPVVLISDVFPFYETAENVRQLYARIRKIRYNSGRIFFMNQPDDGIQNEEATINENQVLWYLKKRDEEGFHEYMSILLDKIDGSPESLDTLRIELSNVFMTHFRDNGISSRTVFTDDQIIALERKATNGKDEFLEFATRLFQMQQNKFREIVESENIIVRARRYVEENYHENIDREDVAAVAFVTPNYLSKLFKNSMGMNLREYINQLRIDEAKRLLISTSMSVSEIASYVGYFNISYFSTVFHKIVGVSPFDWRNEMRGENNDEAK